jgi:hypothetical protein
MKGFIFAAVLLMVGTSVVEAQRPRQQKPHRYVRRVDPKSEAMRLLFGPSGLPALTRPADPWNRYGYRRAPYNRYNHNSPYHYRRR